jgi:TonB family protein
MKIRYHFWLGFLVVSFLISENCFSQEFHGTVTTPVYTGGLSALKDFIAQNLSYPEDSKKENISGVVTLSYIVNEKGKVENIKILRGIDTKCDSEAVRVTKLINGWQPAIQWGRTVSVKVIMPIEFNSENNNRNEQEITVTGYLSDKSNDKAIEGSLVLVKGTSVGAMTDKDGWYSIPVPGEEYELEFSSMGYETKSEKVGKNRLINVELLIDDLIIDFSVNEFK